MKIWVLWMTVFMVGFLEASAPVVHPYHVGSVEINYNNASRTYEITAKFFLDDIEDVINKYQKNALFFDKDAHHDVIQSALSLYVRERILIQSRDKVVSLNFLGFEIEQERIYIYLESDIVPMPTVVTVGVNVLYDLFDDQMNIIHLTVNGKRKSHKLEYPAIYFTERF